MHAVFAVRNREGIILPEWREELFRYISGTLKKETGYALAVGGWKDHVHIFFELRPAQSTADVLCVVKANSARWINENGFLRGKFAWQEGYGAFSYSRSQRDTVIGYIMNQEQHHQIKTFREEYLGMLDAFEIPYEPKYLFEFFE
jgi:REP element-mobilizing transposase RayT